MVKNVDIVVRDYPELASEMLSHSNCIAYDIKTNKVWKCSDTPCEDCKFSNENNSGICGDCNDRAEKWLNTEVKDVSDDVYNKNGEITW